MSGGRKGIFYVYGIVLIAMTRWVVSVLVLGAGGWLLDNQKASLWTIAGGLGGAVLGGWWMWRTLKTAGIGENPE